MSPLLNDQALHARLQARSEIGKFQIAIGATCGSGSEFLIDSNDDDNSDDPIAVDEDEEADEETLDNLFESVDKGEINLDDIMISSTTAGKQKGVDAVLLSKLWRIDLGTAARTLGVTSQRVNRTDDPTLSRNYETNDRMLRYKRLDEYFFMDTFFATKKLGKSTRGNTCCQLFLTDKGGFVYVVPLKTKIEVLLAVKQFAKEIGAPDAIICDMSGEQT